VKVWVTVRVAYVLGVPCALPGKDPDGGAAAQEATMKLGKGLRRMGHLRGGQEEGLGEAQLQEATVKLGRSCAGWAIFEVAKKRGLVGRSPRKPP
jgi:hypothetical protein